MDFVIKNQLAINPSRNWDDDGDEEYKPSKEKIFLSSPIWTWTKGKVSKEIETGSSNSLKINNLFIGIQGAGAIALKSCLESKSKGLSSIIATISLPETPISNLCPNLESPLCPISVLYRINEETNDYMLIVQANIEGERSYDWTTTLFSKLSPTITHIFDTLSISSYTPFLESITQYTPSAEPVHPPIVRYLASNSAISSSSSILSTFKTLEAPSVMNGLSAAILTASQMSSSSAILWISIQERKLHQEVALAFSSILTTCKLLSTHKIEEWTKQVAQDINIFAKKKSDQKRDQLYL